MTTGLGSGVANSAGRARPDSALRSGSISDAVGDHHRGRALATEELAQRRRAPGFGEFLQVFDLGFADHLDAVRVHEIEMPDERHARVFRRRRFEQARAPIVSGDPLEFQGRGLGFEQVVGCQQWRSRQGGRLQVRGRPQSGPHADAPRRRHGGSRHPSAGPGPSTPRRPPARCPARSAGMQPWRMSPATDSGWCGLALQHRRWRHGDIGYVRAAVGNAGRGDGRVSACFVCAASPRRGGGC